MNQAPTGNSDNEVQTENSSSHVAENKDVRALIQAVRDGDLKAYSEVVKLYQRRISGLALMIVRDRAGAEDVAQDAFVRAYTHLDRYDDSREFYPWLATITVRLAKNSLRSQARTATREATALAEDIDTSFSPDFLNELIADERGQHLWQSVASLPTGERTATLLYYRQEMKVTDIATAMDVSSGTIKTLLFRARQKLRISMLEGDPEYANQVEK
jgi:RNA polymerase sigma-70 factor, ECF subfamily